MKLMRFAKVNHFLEVTQLERAEQGLEASSDHLWISIPRSSAKALAVEMESGGVCANPHTDIWEISTQVKSLDFNCEN